MTEPRRKTFPKQEFSWVAAAKDKKTANVQPCPDYFNEADLIQQLNSENFANFVKEKEVVLVMFHDPCETNCLISKNHFIFAAKTVQRENSALAAVDCSAEPELCDKAQVRSVPFFKLYSRAALAATVTEYNSFIYSRMRDYVEHCPVVDPSIHPEQCPALSSSVHPAETCKKA